MDEKMDKYPPSAHAIYCKVLRPAYERMMVKHLYLNNINLKSENSGQLLKKRKPTTGYLGSKFATSTSYWNPTFTEHWQILNSSLELSPTLLPCKDGNSQISRKLPYPILTDEKNLRSSAQSKMFSVTTRVREYSVNNKSYTRKGVRSPSAHSVRTAAITGRSLFSPVSCPNLTTNSAEDPKRLKTAQNLRHFRETERLSETRERKRLAQVASHRIDRMYYMQGSASKLHKRHTFDEEELTKMRDIAISKREQLSTTPNDESSRLESSASAAESLTTVIPTASETDQQNEQEEEYVEEQKEEKGGVNVVSEEVEEEEDVVEDTAEDVEIEEVKEDDVAEESEEVLTEQHTFITDEDL